MDEHTLRQARGAAELTTDAVGATVRAVARIHAEIAGQVYAPLLLIAPIAAPARAVMQIQTTITDQVYRTILAANGAAAAGAAAVLDRLEAGAGGAGEGAVQIIDMT